MTQSKTKQPKIVELAEKIVGKLYCPPPMSPKLLKQEVKKILPLLQAQAEKSFEQGWQTGHKQTKEDYQGQADKTREEVLGELKETIVQYDRTTKKPCSLDIFNLIDRLGGETNG